MGRPTIVQQVRHTVGRALRETGQALDRLGLRGESIVLSKRVTGDEPVIYDDFLSRHRQQMPLLRRGQPIVSDQVAFVAPCSTMIGSVHVGAGSSIWYKAILRADNCDNAESFAQGSLSLSSTTSTSASSTTTDANADADASADAHSLTHGMDQQQQQQQQQSQYQPWELDPDRESRQNSISTGGGIFIGNDTNVQDGCIIDAVKDHTVIGNGVTIGHLASIHSATVEDHCLIGMGSLLQEGVVVKTESLVAAGANVPANTVIGPGELWVGSPARKIRDLTQEERQRLYYQADQYVGVATGHQQIMNLGRDLPDTLTKYLDMSHDQLANNSKDDDDVHGNDNDNDNNSDKGKDKDTESTSGDKAREASI